MRLHLYFARRYAWTFFLTFALFSVMLALIDMLEQVRRFDLAEIGLTEVVRLTVLNLPQGIYEILPLITILASVFLFLSLARSSEMVVARAAGRSALRSLVAPAAAAFAIGALAVAVLNPIVAATSTQYDALAAKYSGKASTLSLGGTTLWLRQGGPDGQTVIRAEGSSLDGTELRGVSFLGFARDGSPAYRIEAARAELSPGAWRLTDAKEWRFDEGAANPERAAVVRAESDLPSDLTIERIRDSFGTPSSIPIWDLPRFIRQLERAGFSARTHRVWMQMELASPFMLTAMLMIGAGFTIRHVRFGRTGLMVLMALMMGFGLHFVRSFARILGERGQIPVELAAWAPPVVALLLALGLLLHLEDG
jgi:lipopolysaccharide export system permease protein